MSSSGGGSSSGGDSGARGGNTQLGSFLVANDVDVEKNGGKKEGQEFEPICDRCYTTKDRNCFLFTCCYGLPILGLIKGLICLPWSLLFHLLLFADALIMMPYDIVMRYRCLLFTDYFTIPLKITASPFILIASFLYPFLLLLVLIPYSIIYPFKRAMTYQFWEGVPWFLGGVTQTIRDVYENLIVYHIRHRAHTEGLQYYLDTEPERVWSIQRLFGITRDACASVLETLLLPVYLVVYIIFVPIGIICVGLPALFLSLIKMPLFFVHGIVLLVKLIGEFEVNLFFFCICCTIPLFLLACLVDLIVVIVSIPVHVIYSSYYGAGCGGECIAARGNPAPAFRKMWSIIIKHNELSNELIGGTPNSWIPQWLPNTCRTCCECRQACCIHPTGRVDRARMDRRDLSVIQRAENRVYENVFSSVFQVAENLSHRTIDAGFFSLKDVQELPGWLFVGMPGLAVIHTALNSRGKNAVLLPDGRKVTDVNAPKQGRPAAIYSRMRDLIVHLEKMDNITADELNYLCECVLVTGADSDSAPERLKATLENDNSGERREGLESATLMAIQIVLISSTMPRFNDNYQNMLNNLVNPPVFHWGRKQQSELPQEVHGNFNRAADKYSSLAVSRGLVDAEAALNTHSYSGHGGSLSGSGRGSVSGSASGGKGAASGDASSAGGRSSGGSSGGSSA